MRMDTRIPLLGRSPQPINALAMGQEAGALAQEYQNVNALRQVMQQQGAAAMRGDVNALGAIARFDPAAAQALQAGKMDMDLAQSAEKRAGEAHGLGMRVDSARLRQIEQASAIEAANFAATADAAQVEAERQALIGAFSAAEAAAAQGPEAWGRFNDGLGPEYANAAFEDAPIILAKLRGTLGGLQAAPQPPSPTDDMREYEAARAQGYPGTLMEFMTETRRAGATSVTVGGENKLGPVPAGMVAVADPSVPAGVRLEAIPGGPVAAEAAAADAAAANTAGSNTVATDTITRAAAEARRVANSGMLPTTGTPGRVVGGLFSESNAAEVVRQVAVLKSIASLENLAALRAEGGTLGPPTDRDAMLLEQATGALDPAAGPAAFARALDNYERTLLRIVHGDEKGDAIFEATRAGSDEDDLEAVLQRYQ
jgi:hypothetical protein